MSDKKQGVDTDSDGDIDFYVSDVVTANDYYPFGMMPGRKFTAGTSYRFGFNGKENDNDVKGEGNQQDYGMRIYDPRVGKFLSVDFMSRSYCGESNYSSSGNSPVQFTDFNGLFKISPYFVAKYPTLARIIQDYLPLLKHNPQIRNAWIKTVGFNNEAEGQRAFDDMVTYGNGPWITATMDRKDITFSGSSGQFEEPADNGSFHSTSYPQNLAITKTELEKLEAAAKKGDAVEIGTQMWIVSLIIMHESSHWGTFHFGSGQDAQGRYERGAMFEYNAFGERFSYKKPGDGFDREAALAYYKKELGGYTSPTWGMGINNKNEAYNYWNLIKNRQLLAGQEGDPFLIDNKTKENVPVPKSPYMPAEKQKNPGNFAYIY